MELFQVLDAEQEKEYRQWARGNWKHGSDINHLWHPVVRAECAQMQAEYPALLLVTRDKAYASGVHQPIVDAIIKAWPDQAVEILGELKYDHLNGCYFLNRWGMYVGIEENGYIHT